MNLPLGGDLSFHLEMLSRYRRDPLSVPVDWKLHFQEPDYSGDRSDWHAANDLAGRLVEAFRRDGFRLAQLDPLGLCPPDRVESLEALRAKARQPCEREITVAFGEDNFTGPIAALLHRLESTYAGPLALESGHLEEDERDWLCRALEAELGHPPEPELAGRALETVALVDEFEHFLRTKNPTKKRFGIEGSEGSAVFLRELFAQAAEVGFREIAMGGMHRGRLATLAVVFGKPLAQILSEIAGRAAAPADPAFLGDVPYHLGYDGELTLAGRALSVSLAPHPSHLITVAPVVLGQARARRQGREVDDVLCALEHTDAAFAGQGLVAEILQLSGLAGYQVGGTIHLVVNNQIGFTTNPSEARTSRSCTDIARMVAAPILRANGDAPLAVARAARLALGWRRRFRRDVVVELVCYRRNGHNEIDEPRFTQPKVWAAIDARPPLRRLLAEAHGDEPAWGRAEAAAAGLRAELDAAYAAPDRWASNIASARPEAWARVQGAGSEELLVPVETGVPADLLRSLAAAACRIPDGLEPHPKVAQFYAERARTIERGEDLNFATAEFLAFATLLAEGHPVRLAGQDSVRGTFTQRHLVVHARDGERMACPLQSVARGSAGFEPVNSPLSEYAALGFEYGVSTHDPNCLVLWEAQFGDFLNGAQIIVDQYVTSAEAKWGLRSGLVLLLPHGLDGGGPDHSSGRIERILQLCAGGNVIVANPSTPANLFHLLRRQIRAPWRKPLFVLAPKALLRRREAVSRLDAMGAGTSFCPLIEDPARDLRPRRIILCSGKIAYDLLAFRREANLEDEVAILRIEQLYPFPTAALAARIAAIAPACVVWCQEEAQNQGAWPSLEARLGEIVPAGTRLVYTGRPALAAAAGGAADALHAAEQATIVARAFDEA